MSRAKMRWDAALGDSTRRPNHGPETVCRARTREQPSKFHTPWRRLTGAVSAGSGTPGGEVCPPIAYPSSHHCLPQVAQGRGDTVRDPRYDRCSIGIPWLGSLQLDECAPRLMAA